MGIVLPSNDLTLSPGMDQVTLFQSMCSHFARRNSLPRIAVYRAARIRARHMAPCLSPRFSRVASRNSRSSSGSNTRGGGLLGFLRVLGNFSLGNVSGTSKSPLAYLYTF